MRANRIAVALATLAGSSLSLGCNKNPGATEVPASSSPPDAEVAAEHACGNHAEGACGAPADSADEQETVRTFDVEPGKFAEANFTMTKGSTVKATFSEGSGEIAWDVHSHDASGGTKIHEEGSGGEGTVQFTAPEDGVFSILWKNAGTVSTPLRVTVELEDGAVVHSWYPKT